ncbi:hypothetical protein P170DRAFT_464504 [Aspergillus steynii IBT 23096]|uniref:Flavoprotein oxygenase n=1 Tax=Aspergillus steynii IBT 23096 TaxID=1392250 RepID=A0A2I2G7R9_9EURO|nr:uncharacterized protein P170DRAFT_464504 [Aspergillus steynii IBT 23096]PLB48924.1 hypothetical protein P170DRAFT_464504 [Aspergillus steynii IBT 23096]
MEDFSHHDDFPDELSRPYSPHDEALDFPHADDAETQLTQDCGYNSSASSTHTSSGDILGVDYEDDELPGLKSRASSRSSVSSLPGSVFTHSMEGAKTIAREAQESAIYWDDRYTKGQTRAGPGLKSLQAIRQRESAFRKPSSVRALQMHTEDEGDEEYLTPPRRRGGHRMSDISMRSSNSSPLKRSPYYSPSGSAGKQKVKKEYPLVLLHCTLLPPSLPIPGLAGPPDPKVLKEVLPSEYWRRWKLLEEKVGSGVLRDRGVLISHPEDMYDLLEDRLLESLELQHPRLDHGHFVGHEEGDSEKEDQGNKEESETDGEQGEDCPDCGERFLRPNHHSRKWEIKVFAANGLMRAGAWAAAWKEMEKVDVEVGLWLPSELRRELEKRLLDSEMSTALTRMEVPQLIEPMKELESQPSLTQPSPSLSTVMPVLFTPERSSSPIPPATPTPAPRQQHRPTQNHNPMYPPKPPVEIDLHTLLVNYIRVLANDRRNVAIALLSILVIFFAIDYRPREAASNLRPFPQDVLSSTSVPSMHISPVQSSSANREAPTNSEMQASIAAISSVAAVSPASGQPSVADIVSTATAATISQAEEPTETEETIGTSSAAIEPPKSQPSSLHDDKVHFEMESAKAEDADTTEQAPAPIVAPAEKQLDLQLDERVEPSLEVVETTFNDTPRESRPDVPKIHDEAPKEVHENEKQFIRTQTAAKEERALIAMT